MTQTDLIMANTRLEKFNEETEISKLPIIQNAINEVNAAVSSLKAANEKLDKNIANYNAIVTEQMKTEAEITTILAKYDFDTQDASYSLPGVRQVPVSYSVGDTQKDSEALVEFKKQKEALTQQAASYESFCKNNITQMVQAWKTLQDCVNAYNLLIMSYDKQIR